jgi:hypothetical protein
MKRRNTREHVKTVKRVERGHFAPGASGNPNGRPKVAAEIREIARQHGPHAIARLVELSNSRDGGVAVNACRTLLDRGYGRPEQAIAVATLPYAGEVTVTDAIDAAVAYEKIMRGDLAPEAVRLLPAANGMPRISRRAQSDDRASTSDDPQEATHGG